MSYHYIITEKATGKRHLIEAGSPSVATADAAEGLFDCERVDGTALAILKDTLPVKKLGEPLPEKTPKAGE